MGMCREEPKEITPFLPSTSADTGEMFRLLVMAILVASSTDLKGLVFVACLVMSSVALKALHSTVDSFFVSVGHASDVAG